MKSCLILSLLTAAMAVAGLTSVAPAQEALQQRAAWQTPSGAEVRSQLQLWLDEQNPSEEVRLQFETLWPPEAEPRHGVELLEQSAMTLALVDEDARHLVEFCRDVARPVALPVFAFLQDETRPALVRNNLRLLYARWLAQQHFYDEALTTLEGLQPADVVDPASLLFYRAVAHHHLLNKDECLESVAMLLSNPSAVPQRYQTVAELMRADIRPLETDSLDEVARLMQDIRRRLQFGRAGQRVRQQEEDVVAKLDKMIKDLEDQQQAMAAAAGAGGAGGPPTQPAQSSDAAGGVQGPGNVDPKNLQPGSNWGNLPPKQQSEVLQQMTEDLPSHYREVIEEYFRTIAREAR